MLLLISYRFYTSSPRGWIFLVLELLIFSRFFNIFSKMTIFIDVYLGLQTPNIKRVSVLYVNLNFLNNILEY